MSADPGSAEAHSALGLMLLRSGDADAAAAPLRAAVELDPAQPAFRMNLAELHAHRGDRDEALSLVQDITLAHPQAWWAWERLGELRAAHAEFAAARDAFAQAQGLRPADPALLFKRARAEFDCGNAALAEEFARMAAERAPGHEAILGLQAELLAARADWRGLDSHAQRWLTLRPGEGTALRWRARALWEDGFLSDAVACLREALRAGPRDAEGYATLARLALLAQDPEAAADALGEAERLGPGAPQLRQPRAILAMYRGEIEAAEALARDALAQDPRDVTAWKTLVQLRSGGLDPEEVLALARLESDERLDLRDRASLAFALGDCHDADGRYAEAFAAWTRANARQAERAAREGLAYDARAREQEVDALIAAFADRPDDDDARSLAPLRPVFIVGLPRSGTTLLESVLGAHPDVLACGERPAMRTIMSECSALCRMPREEELARWRKDYFSGVETSGGARVLIDKNPWNVDAVALIFRLFPEARVLHLVRDADETALSIFRNEFPKFVRFANRLEDIAHYAAQVERLMRHWDAVLPGRVYRLRHEELVSDFDHVARAVLSHCGLAWDECCREFARPGRVISTLSTVQVRQPLGSVRGRAAHYREFL